MGVACGACLLRKLLRMLVVVVVVSTGRPTGITPYPTYGSPFGYILGQAVFGTNVPELFPQGVALHPKQPSYSALTTCPYYRARNGTTVCGSLRTSQTGEAIRSFPFDSISHIVPRFWAV